LDEIFRVVTCVSDLDALHVVRRGVVIGMNKWITEPQWKSLYKNTDDEKKILLSAVSPPKSKTLAASARMNCAIVPKRRGSADYGCFRTAN
jgi:hypothetical protein